MRNEDIKQMIEEGLGDSEAHVTGDGTHFEATVIAPAFEGQGLLQKHRLVYATLGDKMGGEIHALSIRAFTPEEWARQQGRS